MCISLASTGTSRRSFIALSHWLAKSGSSLLLATITPCQGKRDVFVVIHKFSHFVEAYPTKTGTVVHTAKSLDKDFFPRWGNAECIHSDHGTHFSAKVLQDVMRMLNVQWKLHCPYRPQSGQVECQNQTLKNRLSKLGGDTLLCQDSG